MQPLNPFLRAFFRSTLPTQCTPVDQHILLVPSTEVLLQNKDRDTNAPYTELVVGDDFLASHVIKIPQPGLNSARELGNIRESRTKARQFGTINGRTVVVKESFVYSNKGFRNLNQAQLLYDSLYYQDNLEGQQWLIYYISKPLVGIVEPITLLITSLNIGIRNQGESMANGDPRNLDTSQISGKKHIQSFLDVLGHFPIIARQMQPGLEKVIDDFIGETTLPTPQHDESHIPQTLRKRRSLSTSSRCSDDDELVLGGLPYSHSRRTSISSLITFANDQEYNMRRSLETAVIGAIDLFQMVDKQQLSLLGSTTDLTGPMVERLIELYITEQLHHTVLYPRLCALYRQEDMELESHIRQMLYVDIVQVGIDISGGRKEKDAMIARLNDGIETFQKMSNASSPQRMLEILVKTQKLIASSAVSLQDGEKLPAQVMNADILVSLLLVVIVRSQVHDLQARHAYMRGFIFINDVESGELGYALSTFEAVLAYLSTDSGGLRAASRRNKRLWQAVKKGKISEMKTILESAAESESDSIAGSGNESSIRKTNQSNISPFDEAKHNLKHDFSDSSTASNLSHVFPFQNQTENLRPLPIKRVSIDLKSLASDVSFRSKASTLTSITSAIEGDTSIDKLCQTQDTKGNSVLMMAVESGRPEVLDYLFTLESLFPIQTVIDDVNREGTTLLSAAVQGSNRSLVELLVDFICSSSDAKELKTYIDRPDSNGRTVAHFLFHAPYLIERFGSLLPWRHKDKNGQTPLLALCRSYDHPAYFEMVNSALKIATEEQNDGQPLHLDNHVDCKGNTLLHAVTEPYLTLRILQHCDADPNAPNEKQFTPLMVASKYGRLELVRALFLDKRVDLQAKEYRGMTAVELAKDDEIRNRMDNMVLVSSIPARLGRATSVIRSFFVEDGTIRLIIKTATQTADDKVDIQTCRRSLTDFENLAKWLAIEHPASWNPPVFTFRSPFQLPSKPSRAVLHDIQIRLDKYLQLMFIHPTFKNHELLWEFVLAPDLQPEMTAQRSLLKFDTHHEKLQDEYEPLQEYENIESFVTYAREMIQTRSSSTRNTIRSVSNVRNASLDLSTSLDLVMRPLATLHFVPLEHLNAFSRYARALKPKESAPHKLFFDDLLTISSSFIAILSSLARPHALIANARAAQKALDRQRVSLRRTDRWPLGLLEEARKQSHSEAQEKAARIEEELRVLECELRYTQQTVAGELAAWQELHGDLFRRALVCFTKRMLIYEKENLEGMRRALRTISETKRTISK